LNADNRTRGHSFKLVKHRCNCEVRRHFSKRVVTLVSRWNMLDQDTVAAKSVNGFKCWASWPFSISGAAGPVTCELPVSMSGFWSAPN